MFVIITCDNWDCILWGEKKTARSLWLLVCFKYLEFYFYLRDTSYFFSYKNSRFYWIYSHCNRVVSLWKPKAVALVQISICVWSPLLPASDVVSGLPDHNTAPLLQSICSTYTPTIHTIALHTTWQLLCTLQIIQRISCLHRALRSPPHPSGNHLCVWDDRLVGIQPSGAADLTLSDQRNYLISAFKAVDLHAVSVITADRCYIRSLIMESTSPALVLWSHPRLHTPPHFSSTSPWGLEPLYSPPPPALWRVQINYFWHLTAKK